MDAIAPQGIQVLRSLPSPLSRNDRAVELASNGAALSIATNPFAMGVHFVPDVLGSAECRRVIELAGARPHQRGRMRGCNVGTRECYCTWIPDDDSQRWLYDRVAVAFEQANRSFRFQLTGILEPLMAVAYCEGDHFGWHLDAGADLTANRKLSLSLLLTGPDAYGGGDLEIAAAEPRNPRIEAGAAVVFPSFLAHRVTPVTRGRRIALVAFAYGPTFT